MTKSTKSIMICGATGMIGSQLAQQLQGEGRRLVLVGRNAAKVRASFPFQVDALSWDDLTNVDADEISTIVNLSGAGVSDQNWTAAYKQLMRDSRLHTTLQCVALCRCNPRARLINASAVSAYGFYEDDHPPFTEQDRDRRTGTTFLQELIDDWESAALEAEAGGNPVVLLRIGVVLDRSGGALPSLAAPFRAFMGGPVGTGEQGVSFVSVRDVVRGIHFLIDHAEMTGPVNLVSPGACSQRAFAKALAQALGKPSFVRTPAFMIRALMGQLGQELVLTGQRVVPQRLLGAGFTFHDTEIDALLRRLFER